MTTGGPLAGIRVLDLSTQGPGPYATMCLADHGADVVAVLRPPTEGPDPDPAGWFSRGKRSIAVDIRAPGGPDVIARLADVSDVLVESNRPGRLENRGLGPEVLLSRNPRLIYTRLTGWGQDGPWATKVGHDINYIAGSGLLGTIGSPDHDAPIPPMNLLGDFASGSQMAFLGTVLALFERERTGHGQVVDAAMVDGAAMLLAAQFHDFNVGSWKGRGKSNLSGIAPFYGTYRCLDGGWFAVGAIEQRFYGAFLDTIELDVPIDAQWDEAGWSALRQSVAEIFATKTRDEWTRRFENVDGCGTPVLELDEVAESPHMKARGSIVRDGDDLTAAPAPRLSRHRSSGQPLKMASGRALVTDQVLREAGFTPDEVDSLRRAGTIR